MNTTLVTTPAYTDSTIPGTGTYYFVVTAVNTSGLESGYSNQVSVSVTGPNRSPVAGNDSVTTNEDTPVTVDVLANDSDPDGDPISITGTTVPLHGSATVQAGSFISYYPAANYHGSDSFTYTISDGQGGTATAQVSISIISVNDPPVAVNDSATTPVNTAVTINVLANDSDVDGDPLTVTAAGPAQHGSVKVNVDGTVAYTPQTSYLGSDAFSYTVSDGQGGSASGQVSVTVQSTNQPPSAVNDTATTPEDQAVTVSVLANDSDPDGGTLTVTSAGPAQHGTATVNAGGTVTYTPQANYNGSDLFSYTISDGQGGSASAQVTVTIQPVNDNPQAVNDAATTSENTAVTINVLANDSDVDGDPLTVTAAGPAQHGSVKVNAGATVTYTPQVNYNGSDLFSYTISDGQGGSASGQVSVTVQSTNQPPSAVNDTATTPEDQAVTVSVLANDSDPDGGTLTVTSAGPAQHGTAAVNAGGTVTYTPQANYNGSDLFSYTISDGQGGSASAQVTVTIQPVNDNPQAVNDAATTSENTAVTINVLANDSDVDGDPLTVTAAGPAQHGSVKVNASGTVTYTPQTNYTGSDAFSYTISDGQGGSASGQVSVTVQAGVNQPPSAVNDTATTPEDQAVTVSVLANDSDPDGGTLTVTSAGPAQHGTAAVNAGGTVTYTPQANYNGSDLFSYTISDGQGGSASAQVTVTIQPVNDNPQAANDTAATAQNAAVTINVLSNDSDVDGDTLTVTAAGPAQHGSVNVNPDSTVTYTPQTDYTGSDAFSYTISDGQGGSASGQVSVTVQAGVNQPPSAVNDTATTPEDQAVTVSVLANDSDPDGGTLTVTSAGPAQHGTATVNAGGTVTYTPQANYNGSDLFSYTISDGQGGSASAQVTVTIQPVNDNPQAANDTAATAQNAAVTINVLANDSDVDGDTLTVTAAGPAQHGSVNVNPDSTVTYTPQTDYTGSDDFSYTISDGQGGSATGQVVLSVQVPNSPPVAVSDSVTTPEDTAATIPVLANDSDPDNDPLSVSGVTNPASGQVTINADNTITYVPNSNFNGTDGFSYTISDGKGATASATVAVSITPVNDPPSVDAGLDQGVSPGTQVKLDGQASDPDGDTLSYTWRQLSGVNVLSGINRTQSVTFTAPDVKTSETLVFEFSATDGKLSASDQVQVFVRPGNVQDLVFPASSRKNKKYFADTYVGVAVYNPSEVPQDVIVTGVDSLGREKASVPVPTALNPGGQTAFLTSELGPLNDISTLIAAGQKSGIQGFFMMGDFAQTKLDGIGGQLQEAKDFYLPVFRENDTQTTYLYLFNPNSEADPDIRARLVASDGSVRGEVSIALDSFGSIIATGDEIFGENPGLDGYIEVNANVPLKGFEFCASEQNLSSSSSRFPEQASRLLIPHFFVDKNDGTTYVRLINVDDQKTRASIKAYDDDHNLIGTYSVEIAPKAVFNGDVRDLFHLDPTALKEGQMYTGFMEVGLSRGLFKPASSVIGLVSFTGNHGQFQSMLPMIQDAQKEMVFLQVAQSRAMDIFTGLSILNPGTEQAKVQVQAFNEEGNLTATKTLRVDAGRRVVDLLGGDTFFGGSFDQLKGHLRVISDQPVVAFVLFGDYENRFMSAVESQAPLLLSDNPQ